MNKLKRFYAKQRAINGSFTLSGQEFVHAKSVMRLKEYDQIIICCGDGIDYICEISQINENNLICRILSNTKNMCDSTISLTLYQAQVKADKIELITQKVSEIGVSKIVPFTSDFCVVHGELSNQKMERLNKIAVESAKQCGRSKPLEIDNVKTFDAILNELKTYELVLFAYENAKINKISQILGSYKNIAIVIGSEGGFSDKEYKNLCSLPNVCCVTLGNRILRAETASIVCCALAMERFEYVWV